MNISHFGFVFLYSLSFWICLTFDSQHLLKPSSYQPHFFEILWQSVPMASKIFVFLALSLPLIIGMHKRLHHKIWWIYSAYIVFFFLQDAITGYMPKLHFQISFMILTYSMLFYSICAKQNPKKEKNTWNFYLLIFPVFVITLYLILSAMSFVSYPTHFNHMIHSLGKTSYSLQIRGMTNFDVFLRYAKGFCLLFLFIWAALLPFLLRIAHMKIIVLTLFWILVPVVLTLNFVWKDMGLINFSIILVLFFILYNVCYIHETIKKK